MTVASHAGVVAQRPVFTAPHIRMCAVITAVKRRWGDHGERVLRDAYRALGHMTGDAMIESGVVRRGADLETWGRVSEQIVDIRGLHGWTRVHTGRREHITIVPRCAAYCEAYTAIGAPADLCAIPFEWDNGCLDRINPGLEIWPGPCAYQGEAQCAYTIRPRTSGMRRRRPSSGPHTAIPVGGAPPWTNPQAGLYAIVACVVTAFRERGRAAVAEALRDLGEHSGSFLIRNGLIAPGCSVRATAELAGALGELAGLAPWRVVQGEDGEASLHRANPYQPVYEHFEATPDIQALITSWDQAWLAAVNADLSVELTGDTWRGDPEDVLTFRRSKGSVWA